MNATQQNLGTHLVASAAAQAIGANAYSIQDNLITATVTGYGSAARGNRGRYTGSKVHRLCCTYVIGLVDPSLETQPGHIGYRFKLRPENPILYSCFPHCRCTDGQHAGHPTPGLSEADVTCTKCKRR